ncbi:anti-sigma factor, partial [Kineococcus sp. SYSU DK004]|uniref:anti-sigma factor n=1 Tax=Kineococcus sp. SYSU DK004 TaxID=3383125 RepID=UPI003D7DCBF5
MSAGDGRGAGRDGGSPEEDLAAWALDAVDEDERAAVEEHLRTSPAVRREADALRATASRLAGEVPPPPGLRERLLAEVARTPQERPGQDAATVPAAPGVPGVPPAAREPEAPAPVVDLRERSRRRRGWATGPLVAVAASVAVAVAGVATAVDARRDAADARAVAAAERQDAEQARRVADLLGSPAARVVTVEATGGGTATVVTDGTSAAVLAAGMPDVGAGREYQLWLVEGDALRSAGTMLPGGAGQGVRFVADLAGAGGVGISVEPAGGSEQPTTTPVVVAPRGRGRGARPPPAAPPPGGPPPRPPAAAPGGRAPPGGPPGLQPRPPTADRGRTTWSWTERA